MKRLKILVLLLLVVTCVMGTAHAASEVTASGDCGKGENDTLTWCLTDDGTLTISGTGEMKNYDSYSDKSPWRELDVKHLVLNNGITAIGDYAFYSCKELTGSLSLPEGIKSIGSCAFGGCSKLTGSLFIPEGVESIGHDAFYGCTGLNGILSISGTVNSIGKYAFARSDGWGNSIPLLATVLFAGDKPANMTDDDMTTAFCADQTLYYKSGAKGWDNIDTALPYTSTQQTGTLMVDLADGSVQIMEGADGKLICFRPESATLISGPTGFIIRQADNGATAIDRAISVSADCSVVLSNVNIQPTDSAPLRVLGGASVKLTLVGENKFSTTGNYYGIVVNSDVELTFDGSGSLTVNSSADAITMDDRAVLNIKSGTLLFGASISTRFGEDCTIHISGGSTTVSGLVGSDPYGRYMNPAESSPTIKMTSGSLSLTDKGDGGTYAGLYGSELLISGGNLSVKSESRNHAALKGDSVEITSGTIAIENSHYNGGDTAIDAPNGVISIANAEVTIKNYTVAIGGDDCNAVTVADSATVNYTQPERGTLCREKITISAQLEDSAALVGNSAKFAVSAYGHSGLSYQWQTSADGSTWIDVEGQTASTATIPVTAENNGYFVRCKITNVYYSGGDFAGNMTASYNNLFYSNTVKLYQLAFSQQPQDISMVINSGVPTLNAQSTCTNVTYQWQRSVDDGKTWVDVKGETYTTLVLNGTLNDNGSYRCVITATNGDTLASDTAAVTVSDPTAPATYKTVYYLQNADGKTYTPYEQDVATGAVGASVSAPAKSYPHYKENAEKGTIRGTVTADGKLELSRYYDRVSYTITFKSNGGTPMSALTALHGAAISAPSAPSRGGYTFGGWFSDEALTEPYKFTVMPTENITIYAKWDAVGSERGTEYEILGITLRDSNYQTVSKLPKSYFYAEVNVKNLSSKTTDTLTLATYDANGKMLDLYYLSANPPIGYTFTLGVGINNSVGNVAKLKAFMLPTLGGVIPLADAVEWGG